MDNETTRSVDENDEINKKTYARRIALFGGSFDPVTIAHYNIVKNLSFEFDKVIILPCFMSPFKTDANIAPSLARVKMLEKTFEEMPNVKVSKWEIKREQCSYSYITVQHFYEKYQSDELFFVVGSDGLAKLDQWKNVDDIAKKVTFLLVERPDFTIDYAKKLMLENLGIKIEVANFKGEVSSSSLARVANAFGFLESVVPRKAAKYIEKNELYSDYFYITANYLVFNLSQERIDHTYRAVMVGITLAKINGINLHSAITAILLHDIGKNADESLLKRLNITVSADVYNMPAPIRHAPISAQIARVYFDIADNDIINAIDTHTTGAVNMSSLQMLVYLADAIESGRETPNLEHLKECALLNLEYGMREVLKSTIDYVSQTGEVYFKTLQAFEYYDNQVKKNKDIAPFINTAKEKEMEEKLTPITTKKVATKKEPKTVEAKTATKTATKTPTKTAVKTATKTAVKTAVKTAETTTKVVAEMQELTDPKILAYTIAEYLDQKKANEITIVDLDGKTIIADYFVVAGASSTTAVKALCDYVDEKLSKEHNIEPRRRDIDAKWAAIDYGSVILHVFHEETREYYKLEKLWDNGKNVTPYIKEEQNK